VLSLLLLLLLLVDSLFHAPFQISELVSEFRLASYPVIIAASALPFLFLLTSVTTLQLTNILSLSFSLLVVSASTGFSVAPRSLSMRVEDVLRYHQYLQTAGHLS